MNIIPAVLVTLGIAAGVAAGCAQTSVLPSVRLPPGDYPTIPDRYVARETLLAQISQDERGYWTVTRGDIAGTDIGRLVRAKGERPQSDQP